MNKLGDTTSGQPPSCFERHDPQAVQQQPRRAAGFSTIVATTATAFSPVAFKGRASGGFPELQVESDLLPRSSFPSKRIAREGPRLLFKPLKRRVRPAPTGKGKNHNRVVVFGDHLEIVETSDLSKRTVSVEAIQISFLSVSRRGIRYQTGLKTTSKDRQFSKILTVLSKLKTINHHFVVVISR